jgi:hypothetical protein
MTSSQRLVRLGLPALIALAGVVVLITGPAALGMALVGTAVVVFIANWYVRLAIGSQGDRAREDDARRQFDRTGRWPDDPPR